MLKFFTTAFFITAFFVTIGLLAAFFSNEAFAASCTDQLFSCFPKEGGWIDGILGAAKCILQNFVCMINKIISIFA